MGDGIDAQVVDLDEPLAAAAAAAAPAPADTDVVEMPEREAEPSDAPRLPRQAIEMADGRVRLPLRYPVTLRLRQGGQERSEEFVELLMHRLTGADIRAITAAGDAAGAVSLGRSARIPHAKAQALYDRMDGADIMAVVEVLGFFLPAGRPTGR